MGFLLITIAESLGHFPGRKAISDLFLRRHSHLSLSGQLVSFSLTIFYMVLVFKIREGIVGYVVLDGISWQSSSGCSHLCIGTLSSSSPRADFLTARDGRGAEALSFIFFKVQRYLLWMVSTFFLNCNEIHKVDRLLLSFLFGCLTVGLGRPRALWCAHGCLGPTLRPPRVSLLAPF